jgi:hypothetical protein
VESLPLGYKDVLGAFEDLWRSGAGSAEEPALLQRRGQGCVEPSGGLEDPKLPLAAPTGMQFAPTSPTLGEGGFCELLRLDGVLGSTHCLGPTLIEPTGTHYGLSWSGLSGERLRVPQDLARCASKC